jgi:iron complex transport system substrate-binding protein
VIARRRLLTVLAGASAGCAAPRVARGGGPARIVTIGGGVTETVFALGAGAGVIAVDSTSRFPAPARALPQVGYMRALAPEGLISLRPDLLLLSDEAGPPQALAVLRAAAAPLRVVPEQPGGPGLPAKILAVAGALGVDGRPLAAAVAADWAALDGAVAALRRLRALFVLSAARGAPLVSGDGTAAAAMLRAAGAANAVQGFSGYRPLSAEAAATLAPEVIVMMDHALVEAGGAEAVARIPAIAVTPAGAARRIVAMDGPYMLSFGPRAAHARRDLARLLHPGAALPDLPARSWT